MIRNLYQALSDIEKRCFWITIVITIALASLASTLVEEVLTAPTLPDLLTSLVPFTLAAIGLVSAFLILFKKGTIAAWLFQIGALIILTGNVTQIEGYAFSSAFILLAITVYIPVQLLKEQAARISLRLGIVGAVGIILTDILWRLPRLPIFQEDVLIANILSTILFFFLLGTTASQFKNYNFQTKLIVTFVVITIISTGVIAVISNTTLRTNLTEDIGNQLNALAASKAIEIGQVVDKELDILKTLAYSQAIQQFAADSNARGGLSQSQIEQLDQEWMTAASTDSNNVLIDNVVSNDLGDELRRFQEEFPQHAEIFLTNEQGINIASTNRTSDYYQADEEWWQSAYTDGLFIGQPEYDESSGVISVIMAASVRAPGSETPIGILRTTVGLEVLTTSLVSGQFGQTGHMDIYLPDGQEIELGMDEAGNANAELVEAELDINLFTEAPEAYLEITHDNIPTIASQALVSISGDEEADESAVTNLNWRVVALQEQSEAFRTIETQSRNLILLAIIISIVLTFVAVFIARVISNPILQLTAVAKRLASGELSAQATAETNDEIGELAQTFNQMTGQINELVSGLEHRIAERTADVELARLLSERRAQDLQAISEVSKTIATEQRLEILLPLVARLVSERFDFYHVGIFFVDPTKQFAVLQAANSEGGKQMLAREHRLEVGTGIVGTVLQTGKFRIALDVGHDAVFFDNPDLPETRSEMALPLNFLGETIGVLDVQSTKAGAFTAEDASILGILADQVAIAIENARLFGQTQQARDEAEALYNQFLRTEWKTFIQREKNIGYQQSLISGKIINKPVESDEILQAIRNGRVVVVEGDNGKSNPALAIPVQLRGQTIGVLNIKAPTKNRRWNREEINLAQAISDRLALALDNARLLQESQRRAAKEAKIGEVTAKIGASINMRNVLQVAVEELGRALPGSEVVIQFENPKEK